MLVSRKVIRWSAVPLALAVSAGVLVGSQSAGALVTPREGVWGLAITGGTAEFESDYDIVTLRSSGAAFTLASVRDNSVSIPFTLSADGKAYVSDWSSGLGEACGLFDESTGDDDYVYKCLPAEVKFTLPRVIEKRMRGTVDVRVGNELTSESSVVLTYEATGGLPPTPPSDLSVSSPTAKGLTYSYRVRWKPPADAGAGEVTGYVVMLRKADDASARWILRLETEWTSVVLKEMKQSTEYLIAVAAVNSEGQGLPAETRVTTPGQEGLPWVVSLGDSFISGEGGRWAGNADVDDHDAIDALGEKAYWDTPTGETIENCNRSLSAMIHIGVVNSMNFACSGAITTSATDDGDWKPGIDFDSMEEGKIGQARLLENFARTHDVEMVALSIGGNNLNFGKTIKACLTSYVLPSGTDCSEDPDVLELFNDDSVAQAREDIRIAIINVHEAMRRAGYRDSDWTLVSTLYPQPMAAAAYMRYPESDGVVDLDRQFEGGCGFSDKAANWANVTILGLINQTVRNAVLDARERRPNMRIVHMDSTNAFRGRQLCHESVKRLSETGEYDDGGPRSWRDGGAVNRSEWVVEIEVSNFSETMQQESVHPNYWGQLALRNCLRQVYNNGKIQGGFCTRGRGLNERGEPNMSLKRVLTD